MGVPPRRSLRPRATIAPKRMQLIGKAVRPSWGTAQLEHGIADAFHAISTTNVSANTATTAKAATARSGAVSQTALPISYGTRSGYGRPIALAPQFTAPVDICPSQLAAMDDMDCCAPIWNTVNWGQDATQLDFDFSTPSPTTVPAHFAYPSPTTAYHPSPAQPWPPATCDVPSMAAQAAGSASRRPTRRPRAARGGRQLQQQPRRDHVLASILFQCLASSPTHSRRLSEIYRWVEHSYSRIREPGYSSDWKNTVRHNLSQNKSFEKAPGPGPAKSSPWRLSAEAARTGIVPSTAGCRNPNPTRRGGKRRYGQQHGTPPSQEPCSSMEVDREPVGGTAPTSIVDGQSETAAFAPYEPPAARRDATFAPGLYDANTFAAIEAQYGGWIDPVLTGASWTPPDQGGNELSFTDPSFTTNLSFETQPSGVFAPQRTSPEMQGWSTEAGMDWDGAKTEQWPEWREGEGLFLPAMPDGEGWL